MAGLSGVQSEYVGVLNRDRNRYDRSGLLLPADVEGRSANSQVRKTTLLIVVAAIILFSGAILLASGMLDPLVRSCSVHAGDGTCIDSLAEHLAR